MSSPYDSLGHKRKLLGTPPSGGLERSHLRKESSSSDSFTSESPTHADYPPRIPSGMPSGKSDAAESSSQAAAALAAAQATKRIKTARACDSCRRKKIRCDVVDDGGPVLGDPNNGNGGLTCAHCRQYGFECTFFLPITETRFKKKREREAEEMAAVVAAAGGHPNHVRSLHYPPSMSHSRPLMPGMPPFATTAPMADLRFAPQLPFLVQSQGASGIGMLESPAVQISKTQEWPRPIAPRINGGSGSLPRHDTSAISLTGSPVQSEPPRMQPDGKRRRRGSHDTPYNDTRVLGPTSIAYIVHSTAFVPGAAIEEHDLKHHQTFEVGASGNGIIKFHKPPKGITSSTDDAEEQETAKIPEAIRGRLAGDVAEKLVNTYFEKIGYLFPVITKSEFLHLSPPPPLLLFAICGVAALSREVPKEVLTAIKITLNGLFRDMDLMSNSNNSTVKALLIMSLHSDMHASTAVQSGSRCWNRVGAAIRMAQDLGLHRDASGRDDSDDDAYYLEQKRRIWGCCVTADRCMSISLGHPLAIDLTDCDVRLPAPIEVLRYPTDLPSRPGEEKPFAFNAEMLKLSILFGRVMKTIYSPTGLMKTTDEEILGLLNDIDRWRNHLPSTLQFHGPKDTEAAGGILHVSYACLMHLFFRVFMRISYNCPQHLTFSLTIERMTNLIRYSREAIEWVNCNELYLDTMQFVSYGLVFCTTVQYHAWVRRGDQQALATLKLARDCVMRYQRQGEEEMTEELTMRAKTSQVIKLLHESALGAYASTPNSGNLNPTAGVTNRRSREAVRGIVFKPDESRPGGGVYVATTSNMMLDDLPPGTMVLQETDAGHVPALVRTDANDGSAWKPFTFSGDGSGNAATGGMPLDGSSTMNGPAISDLTHVAGGVWADAEGRPVDAQGSRLLTMVPVPNGDVMLQQQQSYVNGQDEGPRQVHQQMPFNAMATGSFGTTTGDQGNNNGRADQSGAGGPAVLSDASWLSAMAAQASSEGISLPSSFNFSDIYTFDGQVAHPAQGLPAHNVQSSISTSAPSRLSLSNGITSTSGTSESSTPTYAFTGRGGSTAATTGPLSVQGGTSTSGNQASHQGQQLPASMTSDGAGVTVSTPAQAIDPLALDGMPGGALDFVAWDQWFRGATSSINLGT